MDDAAGVRGVERVGDLDAERKDRFQLECPSADHVLEGRAVEEFHDEESAAGVLADVVDGADVGVVQGRCGLGFAAETLERLAVLRKVLGQKLQGDEAAKAGVFGLVDHAHATAAEFFENPVVRDGLIEQRAVRLWGAMLRGAGREVKAGASARG